MAVAFLTEIMKASPGGVVSESDATSVFRDLIGDVIQSWSLATMIPAPSNKRVQYSYGYIVRPSQPNEDEDSPEMASIRQTAQNVAVLLRHCLLMNLKTELDQIIPKINSQTGTLPIGAFHSLLLPLLGHLALICSPHEISSFKNLFRLTLVKYILLYVKPEPQPPADWTRTKKGCGCGDCQQLDRFILDPNKKVGHFPMAETRRRHLSGRVSGEYLEDTEPYGSPPTLVLTKTTKGFQAEKNAWQERVDQGFKQLSKLGSREVLKSVLGDLFPLIAALNGRGLVARANALPPLAPAGASRVNQAGVEPLVPITDRKRPATVDLTNDSD